MSTLTSIFWDVFFLFPFEPRAAQGEQLEFTHLWIRELLYIVPMLLYTQDFQGRQLIHKHFLSLYFVILKSWNFQGQWDVSFLITPWANGFNWEL